jgi:large subunit ribosomal protein L3
MKYVLGFKKRMTQVYVDGKAVPATIIEIPENYVALIEKKKGTQRIGIMENKKANKPQKGVYKEVEKVPLHVWSVPLDEEAEIGDVVNAEDFEVGDTLKITGTSKAKGFAGVVKRWSFKGGPRTHGQSDRLRAPGSIGGGTDPGRVLKGKKMPGRMGGDTKSILNCEVLDKGDDYIVVQGPLPGNPENLLKIEKVNENED